LLIRRSLRSRVSATRRVQRFYGADLGPKLRIVLTL
jgi:hypothetical protein